MRAKENGKHTIQDGQTTPSYKHPRLVVLLHAWNQRQDQLRDLRCLVLQHLPDTDIDMPLLPLGPLSRASLSQLSNEIADRLDMHWERRCQISGSGYRDILIIGHSAGATLARTVYLCGLGTNFCDKSLKARDPRKWASSVRRIIMFAAFNRGWAVSYLAQGFRSWVYAVLRRVAIWLRPCVGEHVGLQIYRGSHFITEMRLRWQLFEQEYENAARKHQPEAREELCPNASENDQQKQTWPCVIQLLGSHDDFIAPDDSTDMATGQNFVYLDVPFTDHANIVNLLDERKESRDIVTKRRDVFLRALCENPVSLRASSELEIPTQPDYSVKDLVFVVHGIRDAGYWAQHIARTVLDRAVAAKRKGEVKTQCPSYGYFGMGPFLVGEHRHEKVAWFMEHYLEARARYPDADISYIGHSNGTYLPACALELYPSCRFHRLAFAGSVVRSTFPWTNYVPQNPDVEDPNARVKGVCNFVATKDLVVAAFPSLFESLPLTDLGGAGHRGFWEEIPGVVTNYRFAAGGHAAALAEKFWDSLGDFIISGILPDASKKEFGQCCFVKLVGRFPIIAWVFALLLVAILLGLFVGGAWLLSLPTPKYRNYWIGGSIVGWGWALRAILRKV